MPLFLPTTTALLNICMARGKAGRAQRREEVGEEENEGHSKNKHERANKVNKSPGLIPAIKSLCHFDYKIEAFLLPQYFSQIGRGEGRARWEGPVMGTLVSA